jgi:hypothetical protein
MSAPRVTVTLTGTDIAAKLLALPDKTEKKVIRFAVREGGKPILAGAKIRAPKHSREYTGKKAAAGKKPGDLIKDLKIRAWKQKKGRIGVSVGFTVGGKAFHALFQEKGWKVGKRGQQNKWASSKSAQSLEGDIKKIEADLATKNVFGDDLITGKHREDKLRTLNNKKMKLMSRENIKKMDKRKQIPGLHFIERSYKDNGQSVADNMTSYIAKGIEREAATK